MDIVELARQALTVAEKEGAMQSEVFAVRSVTRSVYVDDSQIKICEEKEDQGIAMRALKGRKLAQASSACVSADDAVACAKVVSLLADRSPASRTYDRFPSPSSASLSPRNWDERIASMELNEVAELVSSTIGAAGDRGVKIPRGVMRTATVESTVINSNGIEVSDRSTLVFANFDAMAEGTNPGEGVGSFNSPWLRDFDPLRTGEKLARQALSAQRARPLEGSIKGDVLIAPSELGEMLSYSVSFALSAENVNKKRSPWSDREGKVVASELLTVVDDPSDPRGALCAAYDDEGVPTTVKTVIERGELRTFLYDSYNSSAVSRPPSGNGMRRQPYDAQYLFQSSLGCSSMNLVIQPGQRSLEELISSQDEGVLVEKFAFPTVDPYSGAFALEVRLAHVIKKGSVVGHIKHALVVGNMYEGLKHIIEIGNDAVTVGKMILPTMAFDGFEVVGNK